MHPAQIQLNPQPLILSTFPTQNSTMAHFLQILITLFLISQTINSQLTPSYYQHSCPNMEQIVQQTTTNKQISSPTTAAATLRLFFHDCFVSGCDASTLITSTHTNKAERDADINLSLPGDAFDLIVRAKTALELSCPMTVSCADILSLATRNLVVMMGGPYYNVKYGRKDSFISRAEDVERNLPRASTPIDQHLKLFSSKGFSAQEMVALTGAHTIGFSHCKEFSSILFNYSRSQQSDPSYYSEFAKSLRSACKDYQSNPTLSVFNDVVTPNKFDNVYYSNIRKGLGLLASDHALSSDARTRNWVKVYSGNQDVFFKAFARAMEKLSEFGVKIGRNGEVRRRCDAFNY